MNKLISIVIPAYNEQDYIKDTINDLVSVFKNAEIIVVSDGSTDNTAKIVRKISKTNRRVKLIELHKNFGKGYAISVGFKQARGNIVGFVDADDAFNALSIKRMIELLSRYDCVIASKWKGKKFSRVNERLSRKFMSRIWNFFIRVLFGMNIRDTQGGAKFMNRYVLDKIGYTFMSKGFEFDVELLLKIKRNNFSVYEMYLPSKLRKDSKFSISHIPKMFFGLIGMRMVL